MKIILLYAQQREKYTEQEYLKTEWDFIMAK